MAPQNFNHIVLSQQAAFGSCTTPILSDGAITLPKIGTLASVIIQDITYTASSGGISGNDISITYIEDVLPGQEMVTVSGSSITVHIGNPTVVIDDVLDATHLQLVSTVDIHVGDTITQGFNSTTVVSVVSASELQVVSTSGFVIGNATDNGLLSTATQVLNAVENYYPSDILVDLVISGTPSNKQVGTGPTNLSNGTQGGAITGIQADSNPFIAGNVTLASGTNVTLSQIGQTITINSTGSGSGANTFLSNLTSPTALNQDIIPDSDGSRSLGSSSLQFEQLYTYNVISNNDDLDLTSTFNVYLASGPSSDIVLNAGSGHINADTHNITNMADPVDPQDAATKNYVDTHVTSPGGSSGSIQFNNSGIFGGDSNLTYNGSQLSVNGTVNATSVTTTNFQLTTSPVSGYVLTSDASGNGTWQFFSSSGLTVSDFVIGEDLTSQITGSNVSFTLAFSPVVNTEAVYLNGNRLRRGGNDYTILGNTITLAFAPVMEDSILVDYIK